METAFGNLSQQEKAENPIPPPVTITHELRSYLDLVESWNNAIKEPFQDGSRNLMRMFGVRFEVLCRMHEKLDSIQASLIFFFVLVES